MFYISIVGDFNSLCAGPARALSQIPIWFMFYYIEFVKKLQCMYFNTLLISLIN